MASDTPQDLAFPFIVEDDEGRLVPLVLSYLAIGQFELARGLQPPSFVLPVISFISRVVCLMQRP